ncbi:MAG: AbrB/MazE/SpoVT family DNA-binding domain-containing protein [Terriglobales bacterium]|jgi:bifunctional DNA-binding transcriptional regulator/antitoxin component of YhaV-PrlF toxin-antitoxin module
MADCYRTVVSSKGQVVIPARLRAQMGLRKGSSGTWSEEGGKLVLTLATERHLDEIMGFLRPARNLRTPGPEHESMFEASFSERELERRREKK